MPENDENPWRRRTNGGGRPPTPGALFARVFLAFLAGAAAVYLIRSLGGISNWLGEASGDATHHFEVMNTTAMIRVPAAAGLSASPDRLAKLAEEAVREIDGLMSPKGEASDVRRLNESPAGVWVEVHPLTWMVVTEALRWHRLSGGAFDPTIGPVKRLFRFNRDTAVSWPDAETLAKARELVGADKLLFDREGMRLSWAKDGMMLDLGAIAKGFAADRAAEVLAANGVKNALVEVGGELRVMGGRLGNAPGPWKTGIVNPRSESEYYQLTPGDAGVATSGDYENYFVYEGKRYEHIIDPRTGLPLEGGVASATVVHPVSCMAADALATTMCVLGRDEGKAFLERQALGLFSKGVKVILILASPEGELSMVTYELNNKGVLDEHVEKPTFVNPEKP